MNNSEPDEERSYFLSLAARRANGQDLLMDELFDLAEYETNHGPIAVEINEEQHGDIEEPKDRVLDQIKEKDAEEEKKVDAEDAESKYDDEPPLLAKEEELEEPEELSESSQDQNDAKSMDGDMLSDYTSSIPVDGSKSVVNENEGQDTTAVTTNTEHIQTHAERPNISAEYDTASLDVVTVEAIVLGTEDEELDVPAMPTAEDETSKTTDAAIEEDIMGGDDIESINVSGVDAILLGVKNQDEAADVFSIEGQDIEQASSRGGDAGSSLLNDSESSILPTDSTIQSAGSNSMQYLPGYGNTVKSISSLSAKYLPGFMATNFTGSLLNTGQKKERPRTTYVNSFDDVSTIANDTDNESTADFSTRAIAPHQIDSPSRFGSMMSFRSGKKEPKSGGDIYMKYKYAALVALFLLMAIFALMYGLFRVKNAKNFNADTENIFEWTLKPTVMPTITPSPTMTPSVNPSGETPQPSAAPTRSITESPTKSPTMAPTISKASIFARAFRDFSPSTVDKTKVVGSKHWIVYEWLMEDPNFYTYGYNRIIQRFCLALFRLEISSTRRRLNEALETWMEDHISECDWWGSYFENRLPCDGAGVYRRLVLINIGLDGTVPTELGLLTRLNILILSQNQILGTLPTQLGRLTNLSTLDMGNNRLVGRIPTEMKNLGSLQSLILKNNQLTGPLPMEFEMLGNLRRMELSGNFMQGEVHQQICDLGIDPLTADCDTLWCDCCDNCKSKGLPPSIPITDAPTKRPTLMPTKQPTPNPTPNPTPFPTVPAPCTDEINFVRGGGRCYTSGESIALNFVNCDPAASDQIAVYGSSETTLTDPLLWLWSCGSQGCFGATKEGSVVLDQAAQGDSPWPLPLGQYKVWLIRFSDVPPYTAIVQGEEFEVGLCI